MDEETEEKTENQVVQLGERLNSLDISRFILLLSFIW